VIEQVSGLIPSNCRSSGKTNTFHWFGSMQETGNGAGNGQLRYYDIRDGPWNVLQVAVFDDLDAPFIEAKPPA
jgi:hypothetical protein